MSAAPASAFAERLRDEVSCPRGASLPEIESELSSNTSSKRSLRRRKGLPTFATSYTFNTKISPESYRQDLDVEYQLDAIAEHRQKSRYDFDYNGFMSTYSSAEDHILFFRLLFNESERYQQKVLLTTASSMPQRKRFRQKLIRLCATCEDWIHEDEERYHEAFEYIGAHALFSYRAIATPRHRVPLVSPRSSPL